MDVARSSRVIGTQPGHGAASGDAVDTALELGDAGGAPGVQAAKNVSSKQSNDDLILASLGRGRAPTRQSRTHRCSHPSSDRTARVASTAVASLRRSVIERRAWRPSRLLKKTGG